MLYLGKGKDDHDKDSAAKGKDVEENVDESGSADKKGKKGKVLRKKPVTKKIKDKKRKGKGKTKPKGNILLFIFLTLHCIVILNLYPQKLRYFQES